MNRPRRSGEMNMGSVRVAVLATLVLGLTACAQRPEPVAVRSIVVFGDSLSDVGTYQVATRDRANPGKFTVNPQPIWVDNVAARYGLTLSPNRSLTMDGKASSGVTKAVGTAKVLGGNGFAEGGARVKRLPSQSGIGNNQLVAPVASQVARFLESEAGFAPDQLVLIDGGTNDVYAQFSAMCWDTDDNGLGAGKTTQAIADGEIARAANDLVETVRQVKAHGAGPVLVAGALDWTDAPFGREYLTEDYLATGCKQPFAADQVRRWTADFNRTVAGGVSGLPGVVFLDFAGPVGEALGHPERFGVVNVTDPACTNERPTSSAVFCTEATAAAPEAGETYLWSDTFHPGPRLHRIISDAALRALEPFATR